MGFLPRIHTFDREAADPAPSVALHASGDAATFETAGGGQEPVMGTAASHNVETLSEADADRRADFWLDLGRGDLDIEDEG